MYYKFVLAFTYIFLNTASIRAIKHIFLPHLLGDSPPVMFSQNAILAISQLILKIETSSLDQQI